MLSDYIGVELNWKRKAKFTPEQAMEAQIGSRSIAVLSL
jgi:hypothetical protein